MLTRILKISLIGHGLLLRLPETNTAMAAVFNPPTPFWVISDPHFGGNVLAQGVTERRRPSTRLSTISKGDGFRCELLEEEDL